MVSLFFYKYAIEEWLSIQQIFKQWLIFYVILTYRRPSIVKGVRLVNRFMESSH